jgi:predicted nucleic acid-binding protein
VPFPDAVIATLGIESDIEVWARDHHFPTMQKVLTKLRLFQEPP